MTLQASGQITLVEIFEEMQGTHTTEELELFSLYEFSQLTPKTDNIAISDFYGYMHYSFGGWVPTFKNVSRPASSFVHSVQAWGYGWTVQSKPSWVSSLVPNSVADASGDLTDDITVNYDINPGGDRSGDVVLVQNTTSETATLTINQDGFDISVDPTSNNVIAGAGTYQDLTDLLADDDWSVISQPGWVTAVSPSSGTQTASQLIDFTVTENTGAEREGDIVFKLDSYAIQVSFTLTQEAPPP